jgi:deoxyguanosine kinase
MKKSFVVFEGPIASGKTTHSSLLAQRLAVEPILEHFLENPFLVDFYKERQRWAALMQLWFLMARQEQLRDVSFPTKNLIITDYSPLKNGIFARALLTERELTLYEQIAAKVAESYVQPNLVVYLDATNEILLQRIRLRNRPFESTIDSDYLDKLRGSYDREFAKNQNLKVLRLSTSKIDLASREDVFGVQNAILAEL